MEGGSGLKGWLAGWSQRRSPSRIAEYGGTAGIGKRHPSGGMEIWQAPLDRAVFSIRKGRFAPLAVDRTRESEWELCILSWPECTAVAAGHKPGTGRARYTAEMLYSRRDLGKLAIAAVPVARALGATKINSTFEGVRIGAITYSFNRIATPNPQAIIDAYVEIGLGEAELMSNHCEALAGAPPRQAQEELRQWRAGTGPGYLEGRPPEVQRRRRGGHAALLQHERPDDAGGHRVRLCNGAGAGSAGDVHEHHTDDGEADRSRGRQP